MEATEEQTLTAVEPGLYENVPEAVYHTWPGASQSRLKTLKDRSPAHLRYELDHPKESTPAQIFGSAVHDAVLLPDLFPERWKPAPEINRRTKVGKEMWAELQFDHPDVTFMKPDDFDKVETIRDAVLKHPTASVMLETERKELSAVWRDFETGVLCRGRFDALLDDGAGEAVIVDLKTTTDASKAAFSSTIYNWGYYIQAGHYIRGAHELDVTAQYFSIIAVEKDPPFALRVYNVRHEAIDIGIQELRPLLELYARCLENDEWPGYPEDPVDITLPPYAWKQIETRISEGDE